MSAFTSLWLFLLQVCVLAALVRLASSTTSNPDTCQDHTSIYHQPSCSVEGHKHDLARENLLRSIDRKSGKWNKNHPRWQILEALHGYDKYERIAGAEIDRFESLYRHVPHKHKKVLETIHYKNNFAEARALLKVNAAFCSKVFHHALPYYNISRHELAAFIRENGEVSRSPAIRTTVSQSLKHAVRDWSPEGHAEREATFPFVLDAITTHLPPAPDASTKPPYKVLVPGSGLGRLAHEISLLGSYISVTSNEWSASMNMATRYLTSLASRYSDITLHPFLEAWSHAATRNEITRGVVIQPPARKPSEVILVEGDFTTAFSHQYGQYSAITTLFFIDTARNLIAYLETIYDLLKPGGIWVNVGPLLYGTAPLVQLSLEEIVLVAESMGFEFQVAGDDEASTSETILGGKVLLKEVLYNFNQSTLYRHGYVAACWVARKMGDGREAGKGKIESNVFDRLKEKWL